MATKKKAVGHTCIDEINKLLSGRNGKLVGALSLSGAPPRVYLAVEKLDLLKREKPPILAANFCPFCGKQEPK